MIAVLKPYQFAMLFSWRSRPNCYDCFYQRLYEFIGLYEHHPDLFEAMCLMEETTGAADFTIHKGVIMRELPLRREEIIELRVTEVVEQLYKLNGYDRARRKKDRAYQKAMFSNAGYDSLNLTSCGLLCGK